MTGLQRDKELDDAVIRWQNFFGDDHEIITGDSRKKTAMRRVNGQWVPTKVYTRKSGAWVEVNI